MDIEELEKAIGSHSATLRLSDFPRFGRDKVRFMDRTFNGEWQVGCER